MMAKRYVLTSNTSPDDWYIRADPHRTVRRRISDFAERFGRLIECQAGWEASLPPGPGAGVGVILERRFVAARWPDAFWKAPESKWWDGYSGRETVVLDDFKDYAMPPGRAPTPP